MPSTYLVHLKPESVNIVVIIIIVIVVVVEVVVVIVTIVVAVGTIEQASACTFVMHTPNLKWEWGCFFLLCIEQASAFHLCQAHFTPELRVGAFLTHAFLSSAL